VKARALAVALVATASTFVPVVTAAPADAGTCLTGAQVRNQVSTFVHSLRDDVRSTAARSAVRAAFVEAVRTARGAKADTAAERRGLGGQISALAKQLSGTTNLVERKALITQIHALQEQNRADRVTTTDVAQLRSDVAAVKRAVTAKVNTRAEGRQVAAFVHTLMSQFSC